VINQECSDRGDLLDTSHTGRGCRGLHLFYCRREQANGVELLDLAVDVALSVYLKLMMGFPSFLAEDVMAGFLH